LNHATLAWLVASMAIAAACSGDDGRGPPTLTWYANPDNGGQARLAARCEAESGRRYRLRVLALPRDATQQREQLVRRLAARDASIDLMSLDLPFVPEFAAAGFLRPFTVEEAAPLAEGVLDAPLASATWRGRLVAAPFVANAQLLWYRRSVARRAGLDPAAAPVTWDALVEAAERTATTVEVQANRWRCFRA
jgi:multiple sugar transport system substrate-binding protein